MALISTAIFFKVKRVRLSNNFMEFSNKLIRKRQRFSLMLLAVLLVTSEKVENEMTCVSKHNIAQKFPTIMKMGKINWVAIQLFPLLAVIEPRAEEKDKQENWPNIYIFIELEIFSGNKFSFNDNSVNVIASAILVKNFTHIYIEC